MMSKKERAKAIQQLLETLYPAPAIPLKHSDPFTLLVAVVLSAQCTDARVNTVTPALFALANTPTKMAALDRETIEAIIRPCGLAPRKAKALQELSKRILKEHKGKVPDSFESLEDLPGVGHKTASVVMSQAFHVAAFPVDTHIHRCAKRWGLSKGKNVEQTEADLKRLFHKDSWNRLHLQIIYFAREYCPARGHDPSVCPVCSMFLKHSSKPQRSKRQGQSFPEHL